MKRIILNLSFLILAVSIISSCKTSHNSRSVKAANYIGKWESIAAENLGNGTYASRYFDLKATDWEVKFTLYLDIRVWINQACLCLGIWAFPLRGDGVRVPDAVGRGAGADEEDTGQDQGKWACRYV